MMQNKKFHKLISIIVGLCLVLSLCVFVGVKNEKVFASSIEQKDDEFYYSSNTDIAIDENSKIEEHSTKANGNHLMGAVYFDPAQTSGGSDTNSGKTKSAPVTSLTKAKELVAPNGIIYFLSTMTIVNNTVIDFEGTPVVLKRYCESEIDRFTGEMFVLGSETTYVNVIIKNAIIDGTGYIAETLSLSNYLINIKNASLTMGIGSGIVNCLRENSGSGIYVSNTSRLYIADGSFKNNRNKDSLIIANNEVKIDGGVFENNTSTNNSSLILSYGSKIIVNGGNFNDNKTGSLIFCESGKNEIIINDGMFINNINSLNFDATSKLYADLVMGSILGFSQGDGSEENPWKSADVTINGGSYFKNGSERFGGGVFGVIAGNFSINGGIFKNNFAPVGGVLFCNLLQDGNLAVGSKKRVANITIKDSSFFGNTAGYRLKSDKEVGTIPYADVSANLTLLDVKFLNFASTYKFDFADKLSGGGVFCSTQNVTISGCRFDSNYASGEALETTNNNMQGGGVFLFRGYDSNTKLVIENSFFNNNHTTYYGGVGNACTGEVSKLGKDTDISIYSSNFTENEAKNAGALAAEGNIYVENTHFVKNYAIENGGAITSNGTFKNCYFVSNHAGQIGGAIKSSGNTLLDCNFEYNFANDAGAIFSDNLIMSNTMITRNVVTSLDISNGVVKFLEGQINLDNIIFDNFAGNILNDDDSMTEAQLQELLKDNNQILFKDGFPVLDEATGNLTGGVISNLFMGPELKDKVVFSSSNVKNTGRIEIHVQNVQTRNEEESLGLIANVSDLQDVLHCLSADEHGYSFSTKETTVNLNGVSQKAYALYLSKSTTNSSKNIKIIASDYVGYYDGKSHSINIQCFGPNGLISYTDAKVNFWQTEDKTFKNPPAFTITGKEGEVVYFSIANGPVQSRKVIIHKMELSRAEGYKLKVHYGQKITRGMDVTNLFKSEIVDKRGNKFAGGKFIISSDWSQESLNCYPGTNAKIPVIFEPNNKSMDSVTIYLDEKDSFIYETYDVLYYYGNAFHIKENESISTISIPKGAIQHAVNLLNNNGKLVFSEGFVCDNDYKIIMPNGKHITFIRKSDYIYKIFQILGQQSLKIDSTNAKLTIDGMIDYLQNGALIDNAGTLALLGNITFKNASNTFNGKRKTNGGVLSNSGTTILDGGHNSQIKISHCVTTLYGGAIYNMGNLTLKNVYISECSAQRGGAIYSEGESANLFIENCLFSNNGAYLMPYNNGEIYASGFTLFIGNGKATIYSSRIHNSKLFDNGVFVEDAYRYYQEIEKKGGGIFAGKNSSLTMEGVSLDSCTAYAGGAIYVEGTAVLSNIFVTRCMTASSGAALYAEKGSAVQIADITTSRNSILKNDTFQPDEKLDISLNVINSSNKNENLSQENNKGHVVLWVLVLSAIICPILAVSFALIENKVRENKKRHTSK